MTLGCEGMTTIDDKYKDSSTCTVCSVCGYCIDCGDCEEIGCGQSLILGGDLETSANRLISCNHLGELIEPKWRVRERENARLIARIDRLEKRIWSCRDYLIGVQLDELTVEDTLKKLGVRIKGLGPD